VEPGLNSSQTISRPPALPPSFAVGIALPTFSHSLISGTDLTLFFPFLFTLIILPRQEVLTNFPASALFIKGFQWSSFRG